MSKPQSRAQHHATSPAHRVRPKRERMQANVQAFNRRQNGYE